MSTFRSTLAAAGLTAIVALPATGAAAGTPADPGTVTELAAAAVEVVTEEQAILDTIADRTGARDVVVDGRLRVVDDRGVDLLAQLDELGVELSGAARVVLERLPDPEDGFAPPGVVYRAAIADLARIAATPEAALAGEGSGGDGPAIGLLAIAAISLLVLGAAALGHTLRHRVSDDELAAMAWSDGLTGLANRRRLDHDVALHDRDGRPTAAIMVDVDHFKAVNDRFGHQEGDAVLRRVASMLSDHVRFDDVVYRYGGEEFCILLPGASDDDALSVARRIVDAARTVELPDGTNLTVSVGVAHDRNTSASAACESADQALLAAKSGGRDRIVDASSAPAVSRERASMAPTRY